uniref:Uncharacterized protein n=1 Tax=Setaria viridis TaxID=4556 RepID=A0A4V6D7X1_SETVI|nr:hypothetical protein SEVIR_4G052400v2 [Setaria viridis]
MASCSLNPPSPVVLAAAPPQPLWRNLIVLFAGLARPGRLSALLRSTRSAPALRRALRHRRSFARCGDFPCSSLFFLDVHAAGLQRFTMCILIFFPSMSSA